MFCSQCGSENEDSANFCIRCGANIDRGVAPWRPEAKAPQKSKRNTLIALIATIAVLSAGAIGYVIWIDPSGDPFVADEYILYADGDVGSGAIAIVSDPSDTDPTDGSCAVTLTMNAESLGGYTWGIRSLDQALYQYDGVDTYVYTGHSMPDGAMLSDDGRTMACTLEPGHYSVMVQVNGRTYSGTFVLQGEVVRNYSWTFDPTYSADQKEGIDFTLEFKFQYGDCLPAAEYTGKRGISDVSTIKYLIAPFVSDNKVIAELEEQLAALYYEKRSIAATAGNYDYASFILTFVQEEFSYPDAIYDGEEWGPDEILYGTIEYWAFPTETIMQGAGDCEDTSFLCALLFKAAGYDTAVAMLPGHAMAGVNLTSSPYSYPTPSYLGYPIFQTVSIDGVSTEYYGCETTTDRQYHIGYTSVKYGNDSLADWVGFYPV